jgi:16S rRNA (adenine1518-N6/adenine1519-N6)-dimethyltransferase
VSVKVAYWATAQLVGRVSASVFIPRPRVESVLVRMDRRPERASGPGPGSEAYDRLFSVVRGGFAHRRKMLRRSLEDLVRPEAFEAAGIPSTARAEELGLDQWERLAAWIDRPPGLPGSPGLPESPGSRVSPGRSGSPDSPAPPAGR